MASPRRWSGPGGLLAYLPTARRSAARHGLRPWRALGRTDPRPVFVVGCPRSGTTFTAGALDAVPGLADLGEVNRLKGAIPELYAAARRGEQAAVVRELARVVTRSQRAAMVVGHRAVEQTPECTFLIPELALAFPHAQFVHLVRDGRDVAASLLERGWLAAAPDEPATDDAGLPFGGYARFWVEPDRSREFELAGEARRCGWAWRRYVSTACSSLAALDPGRVVTIRYEELVHEPARVARDVAAGLGCADRGAALVTSFSRAHPRSVGRYAEALSPEQLAEVMDEVAPTLAELGYEA